MRITKISASEVLYIKLGWNGRFEEAARRDSRLYLMFRGVPHEDCRRGDWDAVRRHLLDDKDKVAPAVAARFVGELKRFYEQPKSCLWITRMDHDMWWTFAKDGVREYDEVFQGKGKGPSRYRPCKPWKNESIDGRRLRWLHLPGYVTQVARFQGTICRVRESEAVLRIINGELDSRVKKALACHDALVNSLEKVIRCLYWKDFEILVDLIFQRSGWPRVTLVGDDLQLIDFELDNPVTSERAFAQVKAKSDQETLNECIRHYDDDRAAAAQPQPGGRPDIGYKQMFFVCHTVDGEALTWDKHRNDIFVWTGREVADMTVKTGLVHWVLEKVQ